MYLLYFSSAPLKSILCTSLCDVLNIGYCRISFQTSCDVMNHACMFAFIFLEHTEETHTSSNEWKRALWCQTVKCSHENKENNTCKNKKCSCEILHSHTPVFCPLVAQSSWRAFHGRRRLDSAPH